VLKLPDETKPDLGNIITKEFWQALLWENPKFGAKKKTHKIITNENPSYAPWQKT
jgi:hypothetical protein